MPCVAATSCDALCQARIVGCSCRFISQLHPLCATAHILQLVSNSLSRSSFHRNFQPSLLRVRELCVKVSQLKLHQIKKGSAYTLEHFLEVQEANKVTACEALERFFEEVRAVLGMC